MKLSKIAMMAAIACASYTSSMTANANDPFQLVSHCAASCDCGEPVCGCELVDTGCGDSCDGGCDSACGCGLGSMLGECDLGEQWSLFGEHCGVSVGGWLQLGYHSAGNSLFNSYPDHLQLQQAWLYAEKAIDTSCGFDIGGRVDYMYGTDSQDTQAFGTDPRGWDNSWDNGGNYGRAMPQLYVEAGYGDFSVKAGHFYTLIGYEVVTAPDNFFYSHAYTMYNSEPFTHTGVLGTYNVNDRVTAYGGYTMGWDSGFDDNGDNFLGGLSVAMTDSLTLTYATAIGRFGDLPLGTPEKGYMHSIVADVAVTDNLQYIFQNDWLDTDDATGATVRKTFDINQYLIYSISDCLAVGGRFEWYNQEGVYSAQESDIYALTTGINYKPHANVIVRPEVRWDWDEDQVAGLEDGDKQTTFGVDTIFLF
ncbi:porin [Stieleria sp. TO1_6]|uniref:porin n=1 Tax=Stieleria tagensis TaxID=2956795 RepID=UPI00209B77F3|nr:porin [Stieleria tagensis]MCO8121825.1 porin [Stieleria tagensis]